MLGGKISKNIALVTVLVFFIMKVLGMMFNRWELFGERDVDFVRRREHYDDSSTSDILWWLVGPESGRTSGSGNMLVSTSPFH